MENLENMQPEQNTQMPSESQVVDSCEPTAQPQQVPEQTFYSGAGVGQKEMPFANGVETAGCVEQPQATPHQPWQPWVAAANEPKPKKKENRVLRTVVSAVLIVALVIVSCSITANVCNSYWKEANNLLLQNMGEKLAALQQQIDEQKGDVEGGGVLQPGQTLTAAQIYQQNVSSVVAITCTIRNVNNGNVQEGRSAGTGFVITENGYIVTNHHVIEGATKISVTLHDGTQYAALLVGSNSTNDVAVIKVNAVGLNHVTLGSSSAMQVGDQVVAIGNALGELSSSLTVGYISGMDRDITTDGTVINMIQTDAAINSGNSGGPLFNAKGEVIGITTAKYSGTTSSGASIEGISFAIPLDDVIDMIEDLRDYGYIKSAYLGVMVWEVDATVAETYNLPRGVYVEDVTIGACAARAGVQPKDIIVELGGYTIRTMNDLSRALRSHEAGETVTIVVWRAGQQLVLTITLDEKPAQ